MSSALSSSSKFTHEERLTALATLAAFDGNSRRASQALAQNGLSVGSSTLHEWRHDHAELYEEAREKHAAGLIDRLASNWEQIAESVTDPILKGIARLDREMDTMDARDVPKALTAMSTSGGIAVDKSSQLRGRPTAIVGHTDIGETLNKLRRKGLLVEGEAVEVEANDA